VDRPVGILAQRQAGTPPRTDRSMAVRSPDL
jgi:hypothetical protein